MAKIYEIKEVEKDGKKFYYPTINDLRLNGMDYELKADAEGLAEAAIKQYGEEYLERKAK